MKQALVDTTVTRSTIQADVGIAIVPQTISRHLAEANLKSKRPFIALPLTPEHRQLPLQWCQARSMWNVTDWQKVVLSDQSRFVLGTDDNRVRVWRHPEHVWDQLKRQMPSCHSVHDLEFAVQDLLAHLLQDNITQCRNMWRHVLQLEVVQRAIEVDQYLRRCTPCIRLIVWFLRSVWSGIFRTQDTRLGDSSDCMISSGKFDARQTF
ncbi:HTH_Tnp_Tc3_2 domain-containing protein [Trichonephila clavipes]|nr:HTH_Tnp_Tc3_2 domain-containing protein [Trichonephila clavipes]